MDDKITAVHVIRKILGENALIASLEFGTYHPTLAHFKEEAQKPDGPKERDPFEAVEHSKALDYFKISRDDMIKNGKIRERLSVLMPGQALQVLSHFTVKNLRTRLHIPMIDLEIPPDPKNVDFAVRSIKALRQYHGALLLSGGSYHFYGYEPLTHAEWQSFMHRALLLDDVADRRWIGHRLLDGFSNLRISRKPNYDFMPYVVAEF